MMFVIYLSLPISLSLPSLLSQFYEEVLSKNDTVLMFRSPAVNQTHDIQSLRTIIQLDNVEEELKGFQYHQDPLFDNLTKNIISETSIISVSVSPTPPPLHS